MPRQSATAGGAYPGQKSPRSFFLLVGVLVFTLTVLAYGGLFVYSKYVTKSNEEKKAKVEAAIKDFEPKLTQELTLIKNRIDVGKTLLDNHKAVSLLFSLLELNTVQVLRFKEVNISYVPESKKIALSMKGEARSYNAIAYQSDVFSKVEQMKNPVFSNLTIDDKGVISFDFSAELDTNSVLYKNLFKDFTLPAVSAAVSTSTPTATSTSGSTSGQTRVGTSTPRTGTTTPATAPRTSTSTSPRT